MIEHFPTRYAVPMPMQTQMQTQMQSFHHTAMQELLAKLDAKREEFDKHCADRYVPKSGLQASAVMGIHCSERIN